MLVVLTITKPWHTLHTLPVREILRRQAVHHRNDQVLRIGLAQRRVDAARIGIRFGDFYARHLIEALGLAPQGGVVRVSIAHYNTVDEMTRLVECLAHAIAELRPR